VDQDGVFNVFQLETDLRLLPFVIGTIDGAPSLQNNLLRREEGPAASSKAISTFTPFTDEEEHPFSRPLPIIIGRHHPPSEAKLLFFLNQDPAPEYEYVEDYEFELDS
jgi:hypothetical protein